MPALGFWKRSQRGVAAVVVVAFFGSGLFVALLGMIVDAGFLYLDRQIQQTRADYALRKVVGECNNGIRVCETAPQFLAATQAVLPEGSTLVEVCGPQAGPASGGILCEGEGNASAIADCQAPPPEYEDTFVRVRVVASNDSARLGILDYFYPGSSPGLPQGCAQVALEAPTGTYVPTAFPLALPACFATDATEEVVLTSIEPSLEQGYSCAVQTASGSLVQTDSISGFTLASLQEPDRSQYCRGEDATAVPLGAILRREPNEKTGLCGSTISLNDLTPLIGSTQFIPVVGPPIQGGVGNYEFQVIGFRAFEISGFRLKVGSAGSKSSQFWKANGCESNDYCVSGYFRPGSAMTVISGKPRSDVPYFGLATPVPFH